MNERKAELLDAAIAYLLEHGLAGLSLRPLAMEIGTSARLLIYHFESKDGLLVEVLDTLHERLRDSFAKLAAAPADPRIGPMFKAFWNWATHEDNYASLKLLYELQMLAVRNPAAYARHIERNPLDWLEQVGAVLPSAERNPAMATLLIAVFDGLFIELMSSGDRRRTTRALDQFIQLVLEARANRANAAEPTPMPTTRKSR